MFSSDLIEGLAKATSFEDFRRKVLTDKLKELEIGHYRLVVMGHSVGPWDGITVDATTLRSEMEALEREIIPLQAVVNQLKETSNE